MKTTHNQIGLAELRRVTPAVSTNPAFVPPGTDLGDQRTVNPAALAQTMATEIGEAQSLRYPFRCIGKIRRKRPGEGWTDAGSGARRRSVPVGSPRNASEEQGTCPPIRPGSRTSQVAEMTAPTRTRHAALAFTAGSALLAGLLTGLPGPAHASAVQAALAPNATATSDAVTGMRYTGGAGPNRITVVTAPGDRFLVSDTAPITVGPGCTPATVGGGLFGVSCLAPRTANGQFFRPFSVSAGGGDDVVNNSSTAAMGADGGTGNDTLNGGFLGDNLRDRNGRDILRGNGGDDTLSTESGTDDGLKDVLDGGSGDDDDLRAGPGPDELRGGDGNDTLRGGLGADLLDAGPGSGDAVVYLDDAHENVRVIVLLDNSANDGFQGEKDNVLDSAEIVSGGNGPDILVGNDGPNRLIGNAGDDNLNGGDGEDQLNGGPGNDRLSGPFGDGAADRLDGGPGSDTCIFQSGGNDTLINCEL